MKKLTYLEVLKMIDEHNEKEGIKTQFDDPQPLKFVVVFKQENFDKPFTIKERSYQFRSDNKYFLPSMGGSSLYGHCLDGKDLNVRLDWYDWKPEYYYQLEG